MNHLLDEKIVEQDKKDQLEKSFRIANLFHFSMSTLIGVMGLGPTILLALVSFTQFWYALLFLLVLAIYSWLGVHLYKLTKPGWKLSYANLFKGYYAAYGLLCIPVGLFTGILNFDYLTFLLVIPLVITGWAHQMAKKVKK